MYYGNCIGRTGNSRQYGKHCPPLCGQSHDLAFGKTFGVKLEDKYLKRAGLDYWDLVDVQVHENLQEVYDKYPDRRYFYATTKAKHTYAEVEYQIGDMLVFGKETKGLPEELLAANYDHTIRIPMIAEARSLNLSNSVAIIAYEAMRQLSFPDLKNFGHLTMKGGV